jgi:uncharacterized protein with HEPN domain
MPPREAKKLLYDMQQAAMAIAEFTAGKTLDDYRTDRMLRSAVERQFEIIGEALAQLTKADRKPPHASLTVSASSVSAMCSFTATLEYAMMLSGKSS